MDPTPSRVPPGEGLRHRDGNHHDRDQDDPAPPPTPPPPPGATPSPPRPRRRYGPRTCRICLEVVRPSFPDPSASVFRTFTSSAQPAYVSEESDLGRLISPCRCKGSLKYVHEGCIQLWRTSQPGENQRYWQCPTCNFSYNLARLSWGMYLSSAGIRMWLSNSIVLLLVFLLGFVADPIIIWWTDPVGVVLDTVGGVITGRPAAPPPEPTTWTEHCLKGFFSLGLLGFTKALWAAGPLHWWNVRATGFLVQGRQPAPNGRARMQQVSLYVVVIGALAFYWGVWRAVEGISNDILKTASDRVLDIGGDDEDEEDEDVADRAEAEGGCGNRSGDEDGNGSGDEDGNGSGDEDGNGGGGGGGDGPEHEHHEHHPHAD